MGEKGVMHHTTHTHTCLPHTPAHTCHRTCGVIGDDALLLLLLLIVDDPGD